MSDSGSGGNWQRADGSVANALMLVNSTLERIATEIRDNHGDMKYLGRQIEEIRTQILMIRATLDEARDDVKDTDGKIGKVADKIENVWKTQGEHSGEFKILRDRREHDEPRPLKSITVVEAAQASWPVIRKVVAFVAPLGIGAAVYRLFNWLRGHQ